MKKRREKFSFFNQELIPHSQKIYTDADLSSSCSDYDAFITGSDQVWNFDMFRKGYYLEFVSPNKIKFSYAASIGSSVLGIDQERYMKKALADFDAISVRERSALRLLESIITLPVEAVVDPTLLLSKTDWEKVCAERVVSEPYIFCYFLGKNRKSRRICEEYAKENHFKIVNIPMANNRNRFYDNMFADIQFNATPEEFLSLIKNAEIVFTDSFHATVLSHIFCKQYCIFKREKKDNMSSRIIDITKLFGTEDRYCFNEGRENIEYIQGLTPIAFGMNASLEDLINKSKQFLLEKLV